MGTRQNLIPAPSLGTPISCPGQAWGDQGGLTCSLDLGTAWLPEELAANSLSVTNS